MKNKSLVLTLVFITTASLYIQCVKSPSKPDEPIITSISGTVTSSATEKGLSGVNISTEPATEQVTTNEQGHYSIENNVQPNTTYRVNASKSGFFSNYGEGKTEEGKDLIIDIVLTPESATTIDGHVYDANTSLPIQGVLIYTQPQSEQLTTNADGYYIIDQGLSAYTQYTIYASKSGYHNNQTTVTTQKAENTNVDILLTPVSGNEPVISVTPLTLDFDSTKSSLDLTIDNTGTGILSWEVSNPNSEWLTLSPKSGDVSDQAQIVNANLHRGKMPFGYQDWTVTFSSNGGEAYVLVKSWRIAPVLSISPDTLDFGNEPGMKPLTIENTGADTLKWNLSSGYASWVDVSETSGEIIDQATVLDVTADTSGLSTGIHTTELAFTSNGGNKSIFVSIEKEAPESPILSLSTDTLDFGLENESLPITISNAGANTLSWSMTHNMSPWLSINPESGDVTNTPQTVYATIDRSLMDYGISTGSITCTSNGGTKSIFVTAEKPTPILFVGPDTLDFGEEEIQLSFTVSNLGQGTLNWEVSEPSETWLNISPLSGSVTTMPQDVTVEVDRSLLDYGVGFASLTFSSDAGTLNRTVRVEKVYPQLTFYKDVSGSYSFHQPLDIEFTPSSWGMAFVADHGNNSATVITPSVYQYSTRIVLGASGYEPSNITAHPSENKAFVCCPGAQAILIVNDYTLLNTFDLSSEGIHPFDCAFSSDGNKLYAAGRTSAHNGKICEIDPSTGDISHSASFDRMYASSDAGPHLIVVNGKIFVTNYDSPGRIYVVDESSFNVSTISGGVGVYPNDIRFNSNDDMIYATCSLTGNLLMKIDPSQESVSSSLSIDGAHSLSIAINGTWKDFAFVSCKNQDKITVIYLPSFEIVQELNTPSNFGPTGISVNQTGNEIWVSGYSGDGVKVYH